MSPRRLARSAAPDVPATWDALQAAIPECRECPRLVAHREEKARVKRHAYREHDYWGRPVPAFGGADARILLYGLAPGAHGSNRTGRRFTGDASGEFLFPALHRAGLVSSPTAHHRDDGVTLLDVTIIAAVRCAPPDNQPTPEEQSRCEMRFAAREIAAMPQLRVVLALGGIAFASYLRMWRAGGHDLPRPLPKFGHGVVCPLPPGPTLVGIYHPSRQNTQTGRLTAAMFDAVLRVACELAGVGRRT